MLDPVEAERDQIMEIATLFLPWCRDGNYGCLFDGTSNLSLTGKIARFELGYIPESAKELKAAAGFPAEVFCIPRQFFVSQIQTQRDEK